LIDRELYLPKSWIADRDRCTTAAVPDDVEFATKPRQARTMLERAIAAGVPFAWFTADGAHGPRIYDWAWTPIRAAFGHGRRGWVLARRSISTGEIAYKPLPIAKRRPRRSRGHQKRALNSLSCPI